MAQVYANNLYTVTVGDTTSVATTISINSNAGFPVLAVGNWFYVTLTAPKGSIETQWEIVKVTAHTATSITVVRAQDGTVPVGWVSGTGVSGRVVAGDMNTTETFKNSVGVVSGIATLDNTGKLTTTQIPVIASAGKLTTGRTISLTGPVTGSVLFDGSADVSIAAAVTANGHTHTISNISDWPVAVTAAELNYVDGATSNIQTQLNGKSSTAHTHTLDNLSDVSIVAPATTHELYYTGTGWANRIKPVIDHSSLSGLSTGDPHTQYLNTTRADSLYAGLVSPVLTGTPTAPTALAGTNTTQLATTAFVLDNSVNSLVDLGVTIATASELNLVSGVTSAIQTQLNGKAQTVHTHTISQISDWPVAVTMIEVGYMDGVTSDIQTQLDTKASIASPAFTGTPTTPTAIANTNTTQVASTAFVLANSIKTLSQLGVTATAAELNFTAGATSAIQTQLNTKAALNSPALTGVPTVPTATAGTNTTQIASTAFVLANATPAQEPTSTSYTYNSDDTIATITENLPSGVATSTISYLSDGKVNTIVVVLNTITTTYTYSYDATGKIATITKT